MNANRIKALLALAAWPASASAQAHVWTGPDTGPWHTGANWMPAGVPGVGSDVVIDGETATPRTVNLDSGGNVVNRVTVSTGDTLRVNGNTSLQTGAAGYTINGLLELTGGGATRVIVPVADTVLDGSGEMRMQPGTRIHGGGSLLIRGAVTGAGNAGWNESFFVIESGGRLAATTAGQMLALDPRNRGIDPGILNQGLMEAMGGGILLFSGFGGGWYDNTSGTVRAMEGSEVQFQTDASIAGGTLTTGGTGLLRALGGHNTYWADLTHTGRTAVGNNGWLRTSGTITNTGTITLEAAGNNTRLQMQAATTLTGAGKLVLSGSPNAQIGGAPLLTNTGGHIIEGQGNAGINETQVINETGSVIQANVNGAVLTLDPGSLGNAPGLINRGVLRARDGGVLQFNGFGGGWFDNAGGTVSAMEGSEVQFINDASITYGTLTTEGAGLLRALSGHNTYWTDLTHTGRTAVGNNGYLRTSGTITNTGTITLEAAGNSTRLQMQAATTLTGAGKLVMSGSPNAQIGGAPLLTNTGGHIIEGQGNAGINETQVINETGSVIQANVNGAVLTLDPRSLGSTPGLINSGVLRARDGGVLQFNGFGGGWFDNTGGTVSAMEGSEVQFINDASITYGTLTTEGSGLLRALSGHNTYWTDLTHTGRTAVGNNGFLRTSGTITNTGTITLEAAGNNTRLQIQAATTLTGAGRLVMSGSANAQLGGVQDLTHTGGHTIEGQGNIGINETFVVNEAGGLIQANVSAAVLNLDPRTRGNDPGLINRGVLRARDGGVLQFSGFGNGWFDNTGGIVRAMEGSEVLFVNDASIAYGTLTTEGTGLLRVPGGHSSLWADLSHTGRTTVGNNSFLRTSGTITNTGTITLEAVANSTRLQMHAATTLTGAGKLVMSGSPNAQLGGVQDLTHTGGHTIEGQGNIGINETLVVNEAGGLIQANVPGATLALDPRSRDAQSLPGFLNRGTLQARDGGVLWLTGFGSGWFDNTDGTIRARDGSEVQMVDNVSIYRGTLISEGTGRLRVLDSRSAYWTELQHSGQTVVNNNAWLRTRGVIQNPGAITLAALSNSTRLQLEANTTLNSGGKLIMAGVDNDNAHIGGGFLLTSDNHTIEGHGNIGINESAFFNTDTGLVNANFPGRGLTLDPGNARLVTNRGTLRASGGGLMFLSGFGGGAFDNVNGVVEALDGSKVTFVNNPTFSGGVLRTEGSGIIELAASNTMSLTSNTANTGLFHTLNNSTLYTAGLLNNTGTIRLTGEGNLTSLLLSDNTTLTGGGIIHLDGNARIAGGAVLIVADQTIRGTGNIGWNESSISVGAAGLVIADVPGGTLTFDPAPIFGFTNDGILRAQNGGILNLSSFGGGEMFVGATGRMEALEGGRIQFDNNTNLMNLAGGTLTGGAWRVQGRTAATSLQLPGGTITASAAVIELDGAQAQFAQINGLTANNGTLTLANGASLSPAGAFTNAGALDIAAASAVNAAGAVTLTPSSSLTCHIGGTSTAGSLNSAAPAGSTAIAGKLTVVFDPGFTPAAGNSWPIISGPPTGTFSQFTVLGLPSSLRAALEYTPNFVNVTLTTRDGINFSDWASNYAFASPEDAAPTVDPDGDGLANLLEFALGAHPLMFEPGAAPEPVIVTVAAQQHLGLRYWKPVGASRRLGITYTPERSPAAATWTGSDIVLHSIVPADATGREQITVRHTAPVTARQLMRLRVTQP